MTKPSSKVVFEEPPTRVYRYDWPAIAGKLRASPGKWATVFEHDRASLAHAIRNEHIAALKPSLGFEIQTYNNTRPDDGPRMCTLAIRYVAPTKKKAVKK